MSGAKLEDMPFKMPLAHEGAGAVWTDEQRPLSFAILGAAGFVAPRHMEAIRKIGGRIVAAVDPSDAVGVLDRYAPECLYFRHFEAFLPWLKRQHEELHVVVATPNDLHVGQALAVQECGHVPIVEKPVGLSLADANLLLGAPGYAVLQMRYHKAARAFLEAFRTRRMGTSNVRLVYHVRRGPWFRQSWKGDERRSGGPEFNIVVHALDLLAQAFGGGGKLLLGRPQDAWSASGFRCRLVFPRAEADLDVDTNAEETRRVLELDGETFDLSDAAGLHDEFYRHVAAGDAPTIEDALGSVALAEAIRKW